MLHQNLRDFMEVPEQESIKVGVWEEPVVCCVGLRPRTSQVFVAWVCACGCEISWQDPLLFVSSPVQAFIMGRTSKNSVKHGGKSSRQPPGMGPVKLVNGKHIDGQPLKLIVQVGSMARLPHGSRLLAYEKMPALQPSFFCSALTSRGV